MKNERWEKRVERLYHDARELNGVEQSRFLDEACGSDESMRRQIEALLKQDQNPDSLLNRPAVELAAEWMSGAGQTLAPGTKLGPYEIVAAIGAGGMGEVYEARDARLVRTVAIKSLPAAFAHDPERLARFAREAKLLAALNHPNIAAIHDVTECDGVRYLVLEFVAGQTLAERLRGGKLDVEEVLRIGYQIAQALEAAHEKGIAHRDLKPANIKLTSDGKVKVLDFGLAKAFAAGGSENGLSQSVDTGQTQQGMILGTPAYMSPEQARGNAVDLRADIWAFGCVLYELLTGQMAFRGETVSDTVAAVLKNEPDWSLLPAGTPQDLRRLLRRCLAKHLKDRLQHAGDIRILLEEVAAGLHTVPETVKSKRPSLAPIVWASIAGLLLLTAAVGWLLIATQPAPTNAQLVRFLIYPPDGSTFAPAGLAVSPNGSHIAYVVIGKGRKTLWVHNLGSVDSRQLEGTDGAQSPFWSPDSRSIAFATQGKLKTVDLSGGIPRTLCDASQFLLGTWGGDGVIIFGTSPTGQDAVLYKTTAEGGAATPLTKFDPERGEHTHNTPGFLSDGRHYIYTAGLRGRAGSTSTNPQHSALYLGSLDSDAASLIGPVPMSRYASPGYVLFPQNGLYAQPFDASTARLSGQPVRIVTDLLDPTTLSVSTTGVIAYAQATKAATQLVWVNRTGDQLGTVGTVMQDQSDPQLSRDGKRIMVTRQVEGAPRIWLIETARGVASPWTFERKPDNSAVFSPDGTRIVHNSIQGGAFDLYEGPTTVGTGQARLLLKSEFNKIPSDWSADGRYILYSESTAKGNRNLWGLSLANPMEAIRLTENDSDEWQAQFSPDGKWIAFVSNRTGDNEVFVQRFPKATSHHRISANGGTQPRWGHDGAELFYIASDQRLMAVEVQLPVRNPDADLEVGKSSPLFQVRAVPSVYDQNQQQYAVTADGKQFLLNAPVEHSGKPSHGHFQFNRLR